MTPTTLRGLASAALAVSVLSVALALAAYWRAAGRHDIESAHAQLRADIDSLRARQTEMMADTHERLDEAYALNRDRLLRLRESLRLEKDRADAELRTQLERTEADVNALMAAVETESRTARDSTLAAAQQVEHGLAKRVRTVEGRAALLRAKYKVKRARVLSEGRDLDGASRELSGAADLLAQAQALLPREHDPSLSTLRTSLLNAEAALQARAIDTRERLDDLLRNTDTLVTTLEDSEEAAGRAGAPGRPSS